MSTTTDNIKLYEKQLAATLVKNDAKMIKLIPTDRPIEPKTPENNFSIIDISIPQSSERAKKNLTGIQKAGSYLSRLVKRQYESVINKSELATYFDINADVRRAKMIVEENVILAKQNIVNDAESWVNNKLFGGDTAQGALTNYISKFNPFAAKVKRKTTLPISDIIQKNAAKVNNNISNELQYPKITKDTLSTSTSLPYPNSILFYIQDLRSNNIIILPATLDNFTDSTNISWEKNDFINRSEGISNYSSTDNTYSFSLKFIANNFNDLKALYYKLQWLKQACYPAYTKDNVLFKPPLLRLRLGDILKTENGDGVCGYFTNLEIDFKITETVWEMTKDWQLPYFVGVNFGFTKIHERVPDWTYKFYNMPNDFKTLENITKPIDTSKALSKITYVNQGMGQVDWVQQEAQIQKSTSNYDGKKSIIKQALNK